jgi:hypothetical protein
MTRADETAHLVPGRDAGRANPAPARPRSLAIGAAALALAGCALLTAPAPLFTPADQDRAFALEEGLWAHRGAGCDADPARSSPRRKSCLDWVRIVRAGDGGWRAEPATKEDADDPPVRFLVVPAAKAEGAHRAPLYVAEGVTEKDPAPGYAAIIPRGRDPGPVRRVVMIAVACSAVIREGDVPDITVQRDNDRIVGCTAATKDAVREATRRAALAELPVIGAEELVWVRR